MPPAIEQELAEDALELDARETVQFHFFRRDRFFLGACGTRESQKSESEKIFNKKINFPYYGIILS